MPADSGPISTATAARDADAAHAALAARLARTLDDPHTSARDLASVSRRYLDVLERLAVPRSGVAELLDTPAPRE